MYKSPGSPDTAGMTSNRQLTVLRSTSAFTGALRWCELCFCLLFRAPHLLTAQCLTSHAPLYTQASQESLDCNLQSLEEKTLFLSVDELSPWFDAWVVASAVPSFTAFFCPFSDAGRHVSTLMRFASIYIPNTCEGFCYNHNELCF